MQRASSYTFSGILCNHACRFLRMAAVARFILGEPQEERQ